MAFLLNEAINLLSFINSCNYTSKDPIYFLCNCLQLPLELFITHFKQYITQRISKIVSVEGHVN